MVLIKLNRFNGSVAGDAVYNIPVVVNENGIAYVEDYTDHMMLTLL